MCDLKTNYLHAQYSAQNFCQRTVREYSVNERAQKTAQLLLSLNDLLVCFSSMYTIMKCYFVFGPKWSLTAGLGPTHPATGAVI